MNRKLWSYILSLTLVLGVASGAFAQSGLIEEKQQQLENVREQIEEQEQLLEQKRNEIASLQSQLEIIDGEIRKAELELQSLQIQQDQVREELSQTNQQLVGTEMQVFDNKLVLRDSLRALYEQQKLGAMTVILTSDSLSDFITNLEYLRTIQDQVTETVTELEQLKEELAQQKSEAEEQRARLAELTAQAERQRQSLEVQKGSKQELLSVTRNLESEYQRQLQEAKARAQQLQDEIAELSRNRGATTDQEFIWPVNNKRITAGFQDPAYRQRFGLDHNAIDVGTPHGTPIVAPADGEVVRARAPRPGNLSLVVIAHHNGYTTVYLHLSAVNVSSGSQVAQGQTIARTGGTPGTPGAGLLTTGPHLHFEVWRDGQAINPLNVLP